jgi:flavin reductase (DIM6/NTAB) family NADH-FMN oxidoreductase RutF
LNAHRELRNALGSFATGVAVLTTRRAGGAWAAVTVNSFTSVSLEPPLLLFGLGQSANCRQVFASCERFAVSVLRHDQQWISTNFARPSSSRWDGVPIEETEEGDLLIAGALATFQCRRYQQHGAGDHVLILGSIEAFSIQDRAAPLVFFRGSYGSFVPSTRASH